tara:strand:- start:199 stop:381 length:183 start_codon:yes stop_codon:yes gene_type:complete
MNKTTITLTNDQWAIVLEAIENYGVMSSEDQAEIAGDILDIIESKVSGPKDTKLDAWSFD